MLEYFIHCQKEDIQRQKIRKTEDMKSVLSTLRRIERKLDSLVNGTKGNNRARGSKKTAGVDGGLDVVTLLSFPDHLRKSAMTIMKLGKAMAEDVAKETGRARAIESAYLNQLVRMGYVKKERKSRQVYFSIAGAS